MEYVPSSILGEEQYTAVYRTVNEAYLPLMGFVSGLSLFALYYGFKYGYRQIMVRPFWEYQSFDLSHITKLIIWSLAFGICNSTIQILLGQMGLKISFLSSLNMMVPAVVGALLTIYFLRDGRNILIAVFSVLYLIYSFIYIVGGTLFIYVIVMISGPLVSYITERKKIPYWAIVLTVIIMLPIFSNRHEHRNIGLYSEGALRFELGLKIIEENYSHFSLDKLTEGFAYNDEKKEYQDDRFEGVTYLGQIVHCHEDLNYSYQYGKTFAWLPTLIIPQMFMPMRPGQNMGTEWAEFYGVKDSSWRCSINFPMLVEFYCNFGWLGMIILSWLNGLGIVWVMSKFNYGYGDINLLLLLFISLKLIVVEANITLNYGLILQVLFVCWLIKKYQQSHLLAS